MSKLVRDLIHDSPEVVHMDHPIREAAIRMGCDRHTLLVVDGDELVGILSIEAVLQALTEDKAAEDKAAEDKAAEATVGDIKTARVAYCTDKDHVGAALRRMVEEGASHLAVLDQEGQLLGELGLVELLLEADPETLTPELREALRPLLNRSTPKRGKRTPARSHLFESKGGETYAERPKLRPTRRRP